MKKDLQILAREILLAFWKVHILYHAAEAPIYGQWITRELRRHGYDISPGTLYPLLQRMAQHGWLEKVAHSNTSPKTRQEYVLTDTGARMLTLLREQVREMYDEVVCGKQD